MKPLRLPAARPGLADIAILCLLGGVIATVVAFAREFQAPFAQAVQIDLRPAALPQPLRDACRAAGWPPGGTFGELEVPAAAQGLVWNGMLSMAGGWFFLMVNEAFRLGNRDYRLPGIGSYMSVALDRGDVHAMTLAIAAMVVMIVCVDQLLWRPLGGGVGEVRWARRRCG